jgi:hypothetical protein
VERQRNDHGADRVEMGDGVQRDATQALREVVSLTTCLPRMSDLVDDDGHDQNSYKNERFHVD